MLYKKLVLYQTDLATWDLQDSKGQPNVKVESSKEKGLQFKWLPSHMGIQRNKKTDIEAKPKTLDCRNRGDTNFSSCPKGLFAKRKTNRC